MAKPNFIIKENTAYKEGKLLGYYNNVASGITPYEMTLTRASDATVDKSSGIATMSSNVPRVDKNGSLIIEPQRTNLVNYSNDLTNYFNINCTIASNSTTSPDGTQNGSKVTIINSDFTQLSTDVTTNTGTDYTFSFYIKNESMNSVGIRFFRNNDSNPTTTIDLVQGTSTNGTLEDVGNDWYRFSQVINSASSTSIGFQLLQYSNSYNAGDVVYFYGVQVEEGTFPTSYIPTNGSTSTRVKELVKLPTEYSNPSSGATVSYLFDFTPTGINDQFALASQGGSAECLLFLFSDIYLRFDNGNTAFTNLPDVNNYNNQRTKILFIRNANTVSLFINGVKYNDVDVTGLGNMKWFEYIFSVSAADVNYQVHNFQVFEEVLTDSEAIELTQ